MNKTELIDAIAKDSGLSKADSGRALESIITTVTKTLKKGDDVVTAGGIIAEVIHIKESMKDGAPAVSMEDRVTIKSGDTRLVVERGRIARVVPKPADASASASATT